MSYQTEQILVVPREKIFWGKPLFYGFYQDDLTGLLERISTYGCFITRVQAETEPSFKQIIPYAVITYSDKVFLLKRYPTQTESRLHHKYSIGVGGHINPETNQPKSKMEDLIESNLTRELHEEIELDCHYEYKLIGYLNDDTNPVGEVHFGLVYQLEVAQAKQIKVKEKNLMTGYFVQHKELICYYDQMETWSQILTKALFL